MRVVLNRVLLVSVLLLSSVVCVAESDYAELLQLFEDWREFERPPLLHGAPDYTAERSAKHHAELAQYLDRLHDIDSSDWPRAQIVDWHLVQAEMNGFDFNHRVWQQTTGLARLRPP